MHLLWKKRLKKLFTDREFYPLLILATLMLSVLASFVTIPLFTVFIGVHLGTVIVATLGSVGIILFLICIFEQLYKKESSYDEEIRDEEREASLLERRAREKEEKRKKEEREHERKSLRSMIEEFGGQESEQAIARKVMHLLTTIESVMEEYDLKKEEEYYLTKTLPQDIMETLRLFLKLNKRNQQEMEKAVHELLDKKMQELEERFVIKYDHQARQELVHRIKLAESRDY